MKTAKLTRAPAQPKKVPSRKPLACDTCGPLDYGLLDGYGTGDRLLEGVKFRIRVDASGKVSAETDPKDAEYMADLNEKKWLKEIVKTAEQEDTLECPKCGADIDGPGV